MPLQLKLTPHDTILAPTPNDNFVLKPSNFISVLLRNVQYLFKANAEISSEELATFLLDVINKCSQTTVGKACPTSIVGQFIEPIKNIVIQRCK